MELMMLTRTRIVLFAVLTLVGMVLVSGNSLSLERKIYGTPGPACRNSCAARCMAIRCPGESEQACLRVRMDCRTRCSSRC